LIRTLTSFKAIAATEFNLACHSIYGQLRFIDSITHSEIILFHDTLLVTITVIFVSVVLYAVATMKTRLHTLNIEKIRDLDAASEII
jgi:hypothetical protein